MFSFPYCLSLAWGCFDRATVPLALPALFKLQEILLTKHLLALSYVGHDAHQEGGCEEQRVLAKLRLGALHCSEKMLTACG